MHLACARIGAVLVNVNPAYRSYDLAFVLRKSGMKALFLWEKDKRSDYRAIVEEAMAGQALGIGACRLLRHRADGRACWRKGGMFR